MKNLDVFPDPSHLAEAAAEFFVQVSEASIQQQGIFSVALSGGSTPQAMYSLLATDAFKMRVDWSRTHLYWGDERCVSPDHPDSNYRMVCEALIDNIDFPGTNIHRMEGELEPQDAAQRYEKVLRANMSPEQRFDLVLLGMGSDGHTASLFPNTRALQNKEDWVTANYVPKLAAWRVTLTFTIINQARNILFLICGTEKAGPLFQVLHGDYNPVLYPSQLISPVDGNLFYFVDKKAAHLIQATHDPPLHGR